MYYIYIYIYNLYYGDKQVKVKRKVQYSFKNSLNSFYYLGALKDLGNVYKINFKKINNRKFIYFIFLLEVLFLYFYFL